MIKRSECVYFKVQLFSYAFQEIVETKYFSKVVLICLNTDAC